MNARQLASLVLKLFGIFLLLRHLGLFFLILGQVNMISSTGFSGFDNTTSIAISVGAVLLYLLVCLLIIVKSDAIARRIAPDEQAMLAPGLDADTVQALAFCILGLVLLTGSIPKLAQSAVVYFMTECGQGQANSRGLCSQLVSTVIQFVIGLVLFLQADGLTGIWKKLRTAKGIQNP
ncbi:MAG: hypothetical protein RBU25_09530 [Lentisphaeria bacterium]|nr:hypothetical protein [Lentisphaeria bacterium]